LRNKKSFNKQISEGGFVKIKLHYIKSNHFKVIAKINDVKGWFIIDTGASNTFLEQNSIEKFKLHNTNLNINAQGAGPSQIKAKMYKNCSVVIGDWMSKKHKIASIDLSPINNALYSAKLKKIDGIIGSDILKKGRAIIDFDKNYLYLKKPS
tara:strand:- start:283 stop:738 length:456 start_codon:yes stop_codon:yes gene_type:complete